MNWLRTIILVAFAFFGVFAAAWLEWPRRWLGAQFDPLPALIVFAALTTNVPTLGVLAVSGGLFHDSLSGNPLGLSVLPLFSTGCVLHMTQELVLRDLPYAQVVLGIMATAAIVTLKLLVLLTLGETPLLGWGSFWQLLIVCAWSAILTPAVFRVLAAVTGLFSYPVTAQSGFRTDREIKRGRHY